MGFFHMFLVIVLTIINKYSMINTKSHHFEFMIFDYILIILRIIIIKMKKILLLSLFSFCVLVFFPNQTSALTESEWNNRYHVVTTEPIEFGDGIFYL